MDVIELRGKQFVKASVAARQAGYTSDYIGQLARSGQIEAELVGRSWYVNPEALTEHRTEAKRVSRIKAREQVRNAVEAHQKEQQTDIGNRKVHIATYDPDNRQLLPVLQAGSLVETAAVSEEAYRVPEIAEIDVPISISELPHSERENAANPVPTSHAAQTSKIARYQLQAVNMDISSPIASEPLSASIPPTPYRTFDRSRPVSNDHAYSSMHFLLVPFLFVPLIFSVLAPCIEAKIDYDRAKTQSMNIHYTVNVYDSFLEMRANLLDISSNRESSIRDVYKS